VIDGVTVTAPSPVPLAGDTASQDTGSEAVHDSVPPPVFDTAMVLAAGALPPVVAENDSEAGDVDSTGGDGGATVNVTGIIFGEPATPPALTVTSVV
jgi:hypothetical protein